MSCNVRCLFRSATGSDKLCRRAKFRLLTVRFRTVGPSALFWAALNSAVYRLRVLFVMTFLQMVFQLTTRSGLAGQGHPEIDPQGEPFTRLSFMK
jgi:hypothetical protein